jgi:hypothetical protein
MINNDLKQDIIDTLQKARTDGEGAVIDTEHGEFQIITRTPVNAAMSNNGGDYWFFRRYIQHGNDVFAKDDWSCDFAEYADDGCLYKDCILNDLRELFGLMAVQ